MMMDRRRNAVAGGFTASDARVTDHVFRALLFRAPEELQLELFATAPLVLREDEVELFRRRAVTYRKLPSIPNVLFVRTLGVRLFERTLRDRIYPWLCSRRRYSLLHYTVSWPWGERPVAERELAMVYDLYPERDDPRKLDDTRRRLGGRLDTLWISAISASTARDAVELLGVPAERVMVNLLAVDHHIYRPESAQEDEAANLRRRFPNGFVLFVGSFSIRKNFLVLARAVEALNQRRATPLPLVMAGTETGAPIRTRMKVRSELREIFRKTPFAEIFRPTDREMAALYRAATVLAHPSLFEGFGLTVLEAMACGCPVVCGRHSSLIEVGGDAVEFVNDVRNVEEFSVAIENLLNAESLRRTRRSAGLIHSASFTWDRF